MCYLIDDVGMTGHVEKQKQKSELPTSRCTLKETPDGPDT